MKLKTHKIKTRRYEQGARAEAAEATGVRILEVFRGRLMKEWYDQITLESVAEEAGVTVMTVVRRFGGKEGLMGAALQAMGAEVNARRAAPAGGGMERLVHNLIADYEETGNPICRLLALEERMPSLKVFLDYGRGEHRKWATTAFGETVGKLEGAARERAIDKLVAVTDVYTWKLLRRDMGRGVAAVEMMMQSLVRGVLADIENAF